MWYTCVVNKVGPVNDDTSATAPVVYINLTEALNNPPLFTGQWFYAGEGVQNQMLAVALAAINGQKNVDVGTDPPNQGNSPFTQINRLYLNA